MASCVADCEPLVFLAMVVAPVGIGPSRVRDDPWRGCLGCIEATALFTTVE
jgi:hypothetical protein